MLFDKVVQCSHRKSAKGVVRGSVIDVVVDIIEDSPSCGKSFSVLFIEEINNYWFHEVLLIVL